MQRLCVTLILALPLGAQAPAGEEIPRQNPHASAADVAHGKRLFMGHCAPCHGPEGKGGKGANLARPTLPRAADDAALFRVIRDGIRDSEMPGAWVMIDHEIWQVAAFVRTLGRTTEEPVPGDPARGRQLFRDKGKCLRCHTVGYEGGRMGPVLTQVGHRRSPAHIRATLLDPASTIPEGFMFVELVTKGKRRLSGVRLEEDTYNIVLRDLSENLHSFWKADLAELHKDNKTTPMPSYSKVFTAGELDDLVAYLVSLRGER